MPLILDRETVARLFPMPLALEAAKAAFVALETGQAIMPQRTALRLPTGSSHLIMPCHVPGSLSLKAVGVFNDNPAQGLPAILGCLLYFDDQTGALLALMDAEHLTAMRTGAASALATDLLARTDARVLTVIGTGGQALAQIEGILVVRKISRVLIVGRSSDRARTFCSEHQHRFGVELTPVEPEEAVREADVICCATNSVEPVLRHEWISPGTHINAIGAFRSDMAEVDAETVGRAVVVVDHFEAAMAGAGDLVQATRLGLFSWNQVRGTLGQVACGSTAGRTTTAEVTLFKSVGTAVQDAVAARYIYAEAIREGVGTGFQL